MFIVNKPEKVRIAIAEKLPQYEGWTFEQIAAALTIDVFGELSKTPCPYGTLGEYNIELKRHTVTHEKRCACGGTGVVIIIATEAQHG